MGASNFDGPLFVYGNMASVPMSYGDAALDYNLDAGPSMTFQGDFLPDVRYVFLKDKVQGYTGVVPGHWNQPIVCGVDAIPAALGAATLAAAQAITAATPMTLVTAQAAGITPGVPIRPTVAPITLNGGPLTTVIALDFGFAFGNITAGSPNVTVADSTQFTVGEPLVIMQSATSALLTNVTGITDATHITVGAASPGSPFYGSTAGGVPTVTNATAPIGTGNYWGPSPMGYLAPDAALPYIAAGPGLLLDTRQSLMRGVSVTTASSTGAATNFVVTGYDEYGQLQTDTIVMPAATATTVKSLKTFKYILSVVPNQTNAATYSVGTTDTYGAAIRNDRWENQEIFWAGLQIVAASTGWTAADLTSPATSTTGDVRGTYAVQSASTGVITSLAMTGKRLVWYSALPQYDLSQTFPASPQFMYGVTPA